VDKSLVQVEKRGGEERYRLLEIMRQYGRDRLAEAGEVEATRDRHRDWFLALAERAKPELIGPDQVAWLDRLEAERDNLRAALEWALERGPAEPGLRLAGALWRFWFVRDAMGEGRDWLMRALAAPGAPAPTAARAEALDGACELAINSGDYQAVPRLAEKCVAIYRALGDRRGTAWALCHLANQASHTGDAGRAEELAAEALALAREADAPWVAAQALHALGKAAYHRGDYPLARRRHDESVALLRALGDRRAIHGALWDQATLAIDGRGDYAGARAYLQEALVIARELRSGYRISGSLGGLGILARLEGDYDESRTLLQEQLALARQSGDRWMTGIALFELGSLVRVEGDLERAETLARESLRVFRDLGDREDAAAAVGICGVLAIRRGLIERGARLLGAVDPQSIRLQWFRRQWLSPDDRWAYEESLATARAHLGETEFAAAWAAGQALMLEQAIADALSDDRPEG
jgi:tetratricopeptide (TPR) repeat protein